MIRECFKTKTGILFKPDVVKTIGINPAHLHPQVLPRPNPIPVPKDAVIPPPKVPTYLESIGSTLYSYIPFTPTPTPKPLAAIHPEVTEEEHDLLDCLAPEYDQLQISPLKWKGMESLWLTKSVYQPHAVYPELQFKEERVAHGGAGRTMPSGSAVHGNKIKIHRSVKARMEAIMQSGENKGQKYVPRGRVGFEVREEFSKADATQFEWVD